MSRKYHTTEFRIHNGGDIFRVNRTIVALPFSVATQTDNSIIPESYHVSGMILSSLAAKGQVVSSRLVSEVQDCVGYYIRAFRNNPSAAKHHTSPDSPWIVA